MKISFTAKLWEWQGQGAWCFVSLPVEYTPVIKGLETLPRKGFGSVRVEVTIGNITWKTSIFPDNKSGCYLLPVKKSVRTAEQIAPNDMLDVSVRIIDL